MKVREEEVLAKVKGEGEVAVELDEVEVAEVVVMEVEVRVVVVTEWGRSYVSSCASSLHQCTPQGILLERIQPPSSQCLQEQPGPHSHWAERTKVPHCRLDMRLCHPAALQRTA